MAREKITDRKVLLKFYQEMAQLLENEGKNHQALDSYKKAMELAKQIYRDDDYAMYEL